jgi:hypothetical protein
MLEPLGEAQVVSYVERLSSQQRVTLLSFEKAVDLADTARCAAMAGRLRDAGIVWIRKQYHHRPYATAKLLDVAVGCWVALRWAAGRGRRRILHARGYIPSLMAWAVKFVVPSKFLFDMRGFWLSGKRQPADWIRDPRTMTPPSCMGVLGMKMVDRSSKLTTPSTRMPLSEYCLRLTSFSMATSAVGATAPRARRTGPAQSQGKSTTASTASVRVANSY